MRSATTRYQFGSRRRGGARRLKTWCLGAECGACVNVVVVRNRYLLMALAAFHRPISRDKVMAHKNS